jgi:hypothetical protein
MASARAFGSPPGPQDFDRHLRPGRRLSCHRLEEDRVGGSAMAFDRPPGPFLPLAPTRCGL